jgi:hypothetical protein
MYVLGKAGENKGGEKENVDKRAEAVKEFKYTYREFRPRNPSSASTPSGSASGDGSYRGGRGGYYYGGRRGGGHQPGRGGFRPPPAAGGRRADEQWATEDGSEKRWDGNTGTFYP